MNVSIADLASWRDAGEILSALGRIEKDEVDRLSSPLAMLLDHHDIDVREEAARALFVVGKNVEHHPKTVELLQHDPDVSVRCTAAFGIAASSTAATRAEDVGSLLQVIHNDSESPEVRRSAYEAILILFRRPAFPPMNQPFDPRRDIDWNWLSRLEDEQTKR